MLMSSTTVLEVLLNAADACSESRIQDCPWPGLMMYALLQWCLPSIFLRVLYSGLTRVSGFCIQLLTSLFDKDTFPLTGICYHLPTQIVLEHDH